MTLIFMPQSKTITKLNTEISDNDVLKYLQETDRINFDIIRQEMEMKKDAEYLAMHKYSVWQGKNGYWYTTLKGDIKKKYKHKEDLDKFLINYYKEQTEFFNITNAFDEWLKAKKQTGLRPQSVTRYSDRIKKFTVNNEYAANILKKQFKDITETDLDELIYNTAINKTNDGKEFKEFISHLRCMFKFAKRMKYIQNAYTSYFAELDLDTIKFSKKVHAKEDMTFSEEEELSLVNEMLKRCDIRSLGLVIIFDTGIRISELSAIKKADVHDDYIHICKTEINYDDEDGHNVVEVQDLPKTDSGLRDVYLSETGQYAVKKILELTDDNEWLFSENGERIKSHSFRKKSYDLCDAVGIKKRSPHKIRHRYATKLAYSNIPDDIKKTILGHSDVRTSQKYVVDVIAPEVIKMEIAKVPKLTRVTKLVTLSNVKTSLKNYGQMA